MSEATVILISAGIGAGVPLSILLLRVLIMACLMIGGPRDGV
jgi:hypothetical protein